LTLFLGEFVSMAPFSPARNWGTGAESDPRFRSPTAVKLEEAATIETQAILTEAAMSFTFIGMSVFANNPIAEFRLKNGACESQWQNARGSDFAIAARREIGAEYIKHVTAQNLGRRL